MVGNDAYFLFEEEKDGYATGYTENYLRVYAKAPLMKEKMQKVKVIAPFKDGALAEIIEE